MDYSREYSSSVKLAHLTFEVKVTQVVSLQSNSISAYVYSAQIPPMTLNEESVEHLISEVSYFQTNANFHAHGTNHLQLVKENWDFKFNGMFFEFRDGKFVQKFVSTKFGFTPQEILDFLHSIKHVIHEVKSLPIPTP